MRAVPISEVFAITWALVACLCLLWFKKRLPAYATKFVEMVLMVTADHGPAVAGAHNNSIVAARAAAGPLVSSLASGLLTVGPSFGGALDGAARMMTDALDRGISPLDFVTECKKKNWLIMVLVACSKAWRIPSKRLLSIHLGSMLMTTFPEDAYLELCFGCGTALPGLRKEVTSASPWERRFVSSICGSWGRCRAVVVVTMP